MSHYLTIDQLDVAGKRVLVRVDLNVPVQDGRITDTTRIDRVVPTLMNLLDRGAKLVVISHFGRPKGKVVAALSLRPVASALADALGGRSVSFVPATVGAEAETAVARLEPGEAVLLENLRFDPGEEANDVGFAKKLAALADVYVNDAFSSAHRAHASTEAITRLLPSAAGLSMDAELKALTAALVSPRHPVAALVGGAKVSTKLDVLEHLTARVDKLIVGGGMANTFLMALGIDIGRSLCEPDMAEDARRILAKADELGRDVLLPSDVVIATELRADSPHRTVPAAAVPADYMILDLGPDTARALAEALGTCRTLVWNGPLGAFEVPPFDEATNVVARAAARLTREGRLLSVAGGGDTVAALAHAGVVDEFSYVSTAGGAFLEWLEGKELPGVAALVEAASRTG
jgi:phosphoglycerate kinase